MFCVLCLNALMHRYFFSYYPLLMQSIAVYDIFRYYIQFYYKKMARKFCQLRERYYFGPLILASVDRLPILIHFFKS